jgi:hypothetical protein
VPSQAGAAIYAWGIDPIDFRVAREDDRLEMGGMASTARGPHAARRPRPRPPRRTRWPRRIGGVLATALLLGVAVLMGTMVAPSGDETAALAPASPAATPRPAKAGAKAKAKSGRPGRARLTARQLAARASAVAVLRGQGYLPIRERDYDPRHQLRVLIGYRNGDPLGPRRAFFFVGSRFIGHDTTAASSSVTLGRSGRRWASLTYGVYAPGAKACCPGSRSKVRFEWTGAALAPKGAIPLARLATG